MARYVTLYQFTDQGIRNVKESPARLKAAIKKAEGVGMKMVGAWYTEGPYDLVVISEVADDKVATAFALADAHPTAGNLGGGGFTLPLYFADTARDQVVLELDPGLVALGITQRLERYGPLPGDLRFGAAAHEHRPPLPFDLDHLPWRHVGERDLHRSHAAPVWQRSSDRERRSSRTQARDAQPFSEPAEQAATASWLTGHRFSSQDRGLETAPTGPISSVSAGTSTTRMRCG